MGPAESHRLFFRRSFPSIRPPLSSSRMIRAGVRWRFGRSCERRCGLSPWFGWVRGEEGEKKDRGGGEREGVCLVVTTRRAEVQIQLHKIKLNDIPIRCKHSRNRTKCDILVPAVRAGSEEKKNGMKSTAPKAQRITLIYGRISRLHKIRLLVAMYKEQDSEWNLLRLVISQRTNKPLAIARWVQLDRKQPWCDCAKVAVSTG